MGVKTAYSENVGLEDAVAEIRTQLEGIEPKLIIYFATSRFDQTRLSELMHNAFGTVDTIGCSTAGEIITGKMLKNSIVAMALSPQEVAEVKVEVVENIRGEDNFAEALKSFEGYYDKSMAEMDTTRMVGIVLNDGMSGAEEKVMESIGDKTNVTFIGGSAGDDLQLKATYVYANGRTYQNASVLALVETRNGFDIIKTQSFRKTGRTLLATEVDEATRTANEFNNMPALEAYAKEIEQPQEKAPEFFFHHPLGLMIGDEPYVRGMQKIEDKSICFYCNIKRGLEYDILEPTDIVSDTGKALNEMKEKTNISGIINFHCVFRTLELEQTKQTEKYAELFSDIPTIGFSTYGEAYIGHLNQTSVILLIK